ncbi:hypothetical protein D3C72_2496990 [compost metagenome]
MRNLLVYQLMKSLLVKSRIWRNRMPILLYLRKRQAVWKKVREQGRTLLSHQRLRNENDK